MESSTPRAQVLCEAFPSVLGRPSLVLPAPFDRAQGALSLPKGGQKESASATHALRVRTRNRGLLSDPNSDYARERKAPRMASTSGS
jgi:hypothetical protein